MNFKILSLNDRGIRDDHKRKSDFAWIEKQKADIIFLQETYSTPEIITNWKFNWRGEMIYSHGSNHSRGVLVLIHQQLQFELKNSTIDDKGRFILLEVLVQQSPFVLLNLYAPTKLRDQSVFFHEILSVLQTANFNSECRIIMVGDLNVHLDAVLDNSGGKSEIKPAVKNIKDTMLANNLIDVWRLRNPQTKLFTWRQKNPLIQRRIDYWLISDDLQGDIERADITPSITRPSPCPSTVLKTNPSDHPIGNSMQASFKMKITYNLLTLNIQSGLPNFQMSSTNEYYGT